MEKYIVFFIDGSHLEFTAASDLAAKEYAEYRAKIRGTEVDFIL